MDEITVLIEAGDTAIYRWWIVAKAWKDDLD